MNCLAPGAPRQGRGLKTQKGSTIIFPRGAIAALTFPEKKL